MVSNKRFLVIIFSILILFSGDVFAQFGKNKVQYKNFVWKYIQSPHFDVYYNEGNKEIAEFTAMSAEKALQSIQQTLNYKLTQRVSIVAYESHNDFQQTNVVNVFLPEGVGGVTELFKNRVVVPFQGNYAVYDHVIHHELVHSVLNDMFYGGTFQTAISTDAFMIPLWLNEGICEYESLNGMNTETDMFMRDLTISERLPSLNRLNGYLAYRGGQTFYWYVAQEYGKERIADLIHKLNIYRNTDRAFESTFGMNLEKFSEKWERDIKRIYWPDLTRYDAVDEYATRITDHEKDRSFYNTSPAISPDGEKMVYISAEGGVFGVWIKELDEEKSARKLINSGRTQDFEDLNMITPGISWDPTGKQVVISAKSGGQDALYIVNASNGRYERIRLGLAAISSVTWSPNGEFIAFTGLDGEQSDLFLYNLATEELSKITDDIFTDLNPLWAPDSRSLYFISDREDYLSSEFENRIWEHSIYSTDIYNINLESKEITRLTFDPENSKTSIAISPDNTRLLYVSDKSGIGNIYEMTLSTLQSRPKTNSISGITQISLSPDGTKLLFGSQIKGGYDIFLMRFPFEKHLDFDELPLTEFKSREMEREKALQSIVDKSFEEAKETEEIELVGFGEFDLEFGSQQQLVQPNPDAVRRESTITPTDITDNTEENIFVEKDYKVTFSPDLILSNPGYSTYYGFQGVTQMLFSDKMGDHQIFATANLMYDLRNSQLFVQYGYLGGRLDYYFNAYHTSAFVTLGNSFGLYDWYRFRNFGTGATASLPFDRFRRIELGLNVKFLTKDNITSTFEAGVLKTLALPEIRYVHDNTVNGYYGPMAGMRYFVSARTSPKLGKNGVEFSTIESDFRYYLPFLQNYFTFAIRGAGGLSVGPNQQKFFLGGTDNWLNRRFNNNQLPFFEPEDFAFMSFPMPLRGWAVAELIGNKYAMANVELRYPLFTALVAGPIPILLQGVMGNFFLDVATVWDNDFKPVYNPALMESNLMLSSGVGVRAYILGMPLKMDIAWRKEANNWSKPYYLFSLGFDF